MHSRSVRVQPPVENCHMKQMRGVLFAYLAVAVPALVALGLMPYLVLNLGPARFGALSLLLAIVAFFNLFDFGVGIPVSRSVARLDSRPGSRRGVHRLVGRAFGLQCIVGALSGAALIGLHLTIGLVQFDPEDVSSSEITRAVVLVALSFPLSLAAGVIRCALEGMSRFGVANALRAPSTMATFVAPIIASFFSSRLDTIALVMLVARAAVTLAFWYAWTRSAPSTARGANLRHVRRHVCLLLSYGSWVMLGAAAGGLIILGVLDRLLIGRLIGATSIMIFSVPSDIILRCLLVPAAISSVLIPTFARTVAVTGGLDNAAFVNASRMVARHAGPIAVLVALNAHALLDQLTAGLATAGSALILCAMSAGFLFHAAAHVPYSALHALGRPGVAAVRHLVELPVYAMGVILTLSAGWLEWIGLVWCLWAMFDLLLITWLLNRLGRVGSPLSALIRGPLSVWLLLTIASAATLQLGASAMWRLGGSVAAATYFAWQIFSLMRSTGSSSRK